jgi:hypothetical protein
MDFRRPYGGAQPPSRELRPHGGAASRCFAPARATAASALASVSVSPTATLACPIVSALDQWIASAVQPAALHWFGQPVVEIRQISAYSCRGMNGDPRAWISGARLETCTRHRRLHTRRRPQDHIVKAGGTDYPRSRALRDAQGAACEQFTGPCWRRARTPITMTHPRRPDAPARRPPRLRIRTPSPAKRPQRAPAPQYEARRVAKPLITARRTAPPRLPQRLQANLTRLSACRSPNLAMTAKSTVS